MCKCLAKKKKKDIESVKSWALNCSNFNKETTYNKIKGIKIEF